MDCEINQKSVEIVDAQLDGHQVIKTIWKSYKCSDEQVVDLEREARGQAACPLWFGQRKGRITVTKAHDVLYLVYKLIEEMNTLIVVTVSSRCLKPVIR